MDKTETGMLNEECAERSGLLSPELAKARAAMYRFLGGLYVMEVDAEQLKLLKKLEFPAVEGTGDADRDLQEGYALLREYLEKITEDDLDDLAADYAKVFLAAGDATGRAAFPIEAVYVDKRHRVGGSTEMQMHALYKARGREADPQVYRTMDDHIGLMLEYMGMLCEELAAALETENREQACSLLREQKDFVKTHLTNWAYSFTGDVIRYAERDFYKGVAKVTSGFLKKESAYLNDAGPELSEMH